MADSHLTEAEREALEWLDDMAMEGGGGLGPSALAEAARLGLRELADLRAAVETHRDAIQGAGEVRVVDTASALAAAAKHSIDLDLWAVIDRSGEEGSSDSPTHGGQSERQEPIRGVVQSSWHLTGFGAHRVREKWVRSVRGRDAYVHRRARFHWEVRLLDYAPLEAALLSSDQPKPAARVFRHDPSCAQMNTNDDAECTCARGQENPA